MKNEYLVINLYLYYDITAHKLIASESESFPGLPFVCSPAPKSASDRYTYRMYPTNNLYYIISNGGMELNDEQNKAISKIKNKVVGLFNASRIENVNTAKLTREEINALVNEIDSHITKQQIKDMIEKQHNKRNREYIEAIPGPAIVISKETYNKMKENNNAKQNQERLKKYNKFFKNIKDNTKMPEEIDTIKSNNIVDTSK